MEMNDAPASRITSRHITAYALYLLGSNLAVMSHMTYQTIFMTDYMGVPIASVSAVLLVARFIDFVVSLICGGIIEKTPFKRGKYRSWILLGRWLVIFSVVCIFFNTSSWPVGFRLGLGFVGEVVLNVTRGCVTNAYYALGPVMAGANMDDRFRLSAVTAKIMPVSMIITSALTLPCINLLAKFVGYEWAYLVVSAAFALPYIWLAGHLCSVAEEFDPDGTGKSESGAPSVTVGDMIRSVVQNKQMLVLVLSYSLYYIGTYVISGLMAYYFRYVVGNFTLMALCSTISMVAGLVTVQFMPSIGKKLGKKRAYVVGLGAYSLIYMMMYFVRGNWIGYIIVGIVAGAFVYLFSSYGANYFVDAGEYYLYETGKDTRAVAVSMFSVPMKVGMMLGNFIGTASLGFIGYEAGMTATPEFITKFMVIMAIVGPAIILVSVAIFALFYKLTDDKAAFYASENAKRAAGQLQA